MIGWDQAVHVMHVYRSSQMQGVLVASHLLALGVGFVATGWFKGVTPEVVCPACAVTCGSFACPQVVCTTGHIELSAVLGVLLIFLVFVSLVIYYRWRQLVSTEPQTFIGKGSVDGRRPALGTSSAYRPTQG